MPPIVYVTLAWLAGLTAAHYWLVPAGVDPVWLFPLAPISLVGMVLWWDDRSMRIGAICALALILGAFRYQTALPDFQDPEFLGHYNDQGWVVLEGVVREYPEERDTWTKLEVEADRIEIAGELAAVRGTVLVRGPRYPNFSYGDRLRIAGRLETPPDSDGFSYRDYLSRRGVHSQMAVPQIQRLVADQGRSLKSWLFQVRDSASDTIVRLMPEPEAALLQGILLGIEAGIPRDLYDDYNATGTSHVIVISGSNLVLVAAVLGTVFRRILGRRAAFWFVIIGLWLYVLLVGSDSAVTRAAVMAVLFLAARYMGRLSTAYVSLLAAAGLLAFLDPHALWDVGFQLSFAATLGLILFASPLQHLGERMMAVIIPRSLARASGSVLIDVIAFTLAAQLLTIPIVLQAFGRLSLVSPLANLLIAPAQPPVMALGALLAAFGLLPTLAPLAFPLTWSAWLCLAYTNAIVRWLASWPFASVMISPIHPLVLIGSYALVLLAAFLLQRQLGQHAHERSPRSRGRLSTQVMLGGSLIAAILIWVAAFQLPDGKLHVAFLDVGQGDAILVTAPQGQQILVDGGPSPVDLVSELGRQMPFWDRTIDLVVMTHGDADHVSGLVEVLRRYEVGAWLDGGGPVDNVLTRECRELVKAVGLPTTVARAGDLLQIGDDLTLEVLHPTSDAVLHAPSDDNNESVVLKLHMKQTSFLLTGDIEEEAERHLLGHHDLLASDVLKVSHHGSAGASTEGFLRAVAPHYAVISVGADNKYGHPDLSVMDRLAQLDSVRILRTDSNGTIEFVTDGHAIQVRTEK